MSDFFVDLSARVADLELQVQQLKVGQIQQTLFFRSELSLLECKFMLQLQQLRDQILSQGL